MSKLLPVFLLSLLGALFLLPSAYAQGHQPLVTLTDTQGEYPLGLYLEILEDPSGALTIEDVASPEYDGQFVPSQEEVPNFGYTDSAMWVRFRTRNETSQTSQWRLALHDARMGYIDLYLPTPTRQDFIMKRAGRLLPFAAREIPHHQYIFKVPLSPQKEQTIYLRFETESAMVFPLTLWSLTAFAQQNQSEYLILGLFYGMMLIMIGYNFFLLLSLRDESYLYYVLFIITFLLNQASRDGMAHQYLWPSWPNRFGIELFGFLLVASALKFTDVFLEVKIRAPKLHKFVNVLIAIAGLMIFLIPFVRFLTVPLNFLVLFGVSIILVISFITWRQGYRPARQYLLAWLSTLIGGATFMLTAFGLLPSNVLTESSPIVGPVLLVLLSSLALADRINLLKAEAEQANRELQASEHRLGQFLDALPVGVIILNADQKLHYVNQWIRQMFARLDERAVQGRNWGEFLAEQAILYLAGSEEIYPAERRPLARALRGESSIADDMEVVRSDHQHVPLEVWSRPIFDEQGQVQYAIAALQDITERKQAEAELQQYRENLEALVAQRTAELNENEQNLRTILIHLPLAVTVTGLDGRGEFLNQKFTEVFGYTFADMPTLDEWWILAYPDEIYRQQVKSRWLAALEETKASTKSDIIYTEAAVTCKDGTIKDIEFFGMALNDKYMVIYNDITERKHAEAAIQEANIELNFINDRLLQEIRERERTEEALRLTQFALDHASNLIFWVGPKAQFLYVNQAACELLGYSGEALLTMHFHDIDPNYPPEVWPGHWQSSQERSIAVESHFYTKGNKKIPISLTFTYFEFAGREYNFVFAQDISARFWAAQALRDSEDLLRQIFSSISDHIYVTEFTPEGQRNNLYISPTEALTGYPADKFLEDWGFWASTLIHPDDRTDATHQAERLAEGQDSEVEYRMIRADDTVIWVRDSGRVEKDPVSKKIIVYGVVSDITERKQAAEAAAQRARLNAFSAEVGLALTQGDDLPVMLQACAQAMVNHLEAALARIWVFNEPENLLELQASAGLYTHLDGSHGRIPITEQKICLASTVGEPFVTNDVWDDPRVDQKDWLEQEGIVSLISYPLVVEQQLVGVVAMFGCQTFDQNVVEAMEVVANTIALSIDRKQAEQRLHFQKTLLESKMEASPDGILVVDTEQGQWLAVNQRFIEMWDISKDVYRNRSSEKAFQFMLEQLAEPQEFIDKIDTLYADKGAKGHDEILLKDGRIFDRYTGPVKSADGVYYGRVWFYRDITIRKQAEQEIARLFKKQKRTEKSLRRVNQQIEQRIEELAALNYVTQTIATVTDLQMLLEMITQAITNLFDAFSTTISLFNEARTERTIVALYQVQDADKVNLVGQTRPLDTDQIYLDYISHGKSVLIPSSQTSPLITTSRQSIIERNLQGMMLIPLQTRGEVVGAIAISTDDPDREFTSAEMKLAGTVSGQLAGAVENARLFSAMQQEIAERKQAERALQQANSELQQHIYELATLNQVSQILASTLDLQPILDNVARTIAELYEASSVSISVYDQQRKERTIVGVYEPKQASRPLPFGQVRPVRSDWTDTVIIDSKQSKVIVSPHSSTLFTPQARRFFRAREVTCLMLVPMLVRSENMGLLAISTTQAKRKFTTAEVNLAETIASQIASTIENAQLYKAAEQEIVERKQAQEALAVARDQALEASRFKTQLLSKVSHELRTPLGVILGFVEMLEDGIYGDISEQQKKATTQILDSSKYLTTLVSELLDEAQLETNKLQLKISAFSPAELVARVETSMRLLAQNDGLALTTDVDSNIPATLSGDPDRIQQVLVNLVSNAIKFTEQGGVDIRVFCSNSTYWTMQVSDTGPGIPPDIQAAIFEPFQQVDGSMTRKHRGYGLGLSIVKQLIELMEGQIRLESEVGKGSTFTVDLPLKTQELET